MSRRTEFVLYQPKTILNKAKRADSWFWTRYSVYPYIGCQHGCEFCYCRERKFSPYEDPVDFPYRIKVKENAAQLLRRALRRAPVDMIFTGDYQPAERKFKLSRQLLEVCLEMGFPVFVLERSPLVIRDLDLLQALQARARAVVAFSILAAPGSPGYAAVRQMERLAPAPEKRFAAMQQIAQAGILTGACLMPVLPGLSDDDETLESVVRWTAEHGGQFVLFGGLTLADQQRDYFLRLLARHYPEQITHYQHLYPPGRSYGPAGDWQRRKASRVRELCQRYGLQDRMPRPIIPGDKRALNRQVAEQLALRLYELELDAASEQRQWAYRKAFWAVEDLEQEIGLVYRMMGRRGLESIPGIGPEMAARVEALIAANEVKED